MSTLMPEEKTWEKEGVKITFLCYETMRSLTVQSALRKEYLYDAPTKENPQQKEIPTPVYMFYQAMPLILSVELAETAPRWGHFLKRQIESPTWLKDPIEDYKRIERLADANLLFDCFEGYNQTRETSHLAPADLQHAEPLPPDPDPETGVVDPDALNFTNSSTPDGGPFLTITPSKKPGKRPTLPRQAAR